MIVAFFTSIPWLSLVLLWLSYALLGWYLSAHHIFLVFGACVAVVALGVGWKRSIFYLEHLVRFASQSWFIVLILSTLVTLAVTWSMFLPLIVMPFVTTFLAEVEMRFAGFNKLNTFWFLIILAGFGLGLGELIDIVLLPSMRY